MDSHQDIIASTIHYVSKTLEGLQDLVFIRVQLCYSITHFYEIKKMQLWHGFINYVKLENEDYLFCDTFLWIVTYQNLICLKHLFWTCPMKLIAMFYNYLN